MCDLLCCKSKYYCLVLITTLVTTPILGTIIILCMLTFTSPFKGALVDNHKANKKWTKSKENEERTIDLEKEFPGQKQELEDPKVSEVK